MKKVLLFISLGLCLLHGCQEEGTRNETETQTKNSQPTNTVVSYGAFSLIVTPTAEMVFNPTMTPTLTITPVPTFSKEAAEQEIAQYLETNSGCIDCFWGITPGRSSAQDVRNMYQKLGKRLHQGENWLDTSLTIKDAIRVEVSYYYDGYSINLISAFVGGMHNPSIKKTDWTYYNLDNILKIYGKPSLIGFFIDEPHEPSLDPRPTYDILMRFDRSKFVILYSYRKATAIDSQNFTLCPIADQVNSIDLWYGKEDSTIPFGPKLLEEISSLSNDEFYSLFSSPDANSCIKVTKQKYYQ